MPLAYCECCRTMQVLNESGLCLPCDKYTDGDYFDGEPKDLEQARGAE